MKEFKIMGDMVEEQRRRMRLTRQELARAAGISISNLTRVENGRDATVLTLVRLGRVLRKEQAIQRWFLNLFGGT